METMSFVLEMFHLKCLCETQVKIYTGKLKRASLELGDSCPVEKPPGLFQG
jgi:hypothetical protein